MHRKMLIESYLKNQSHKARSMSRKGNCYDSHSYVGMSPGLVVLKKEWLYRKNYFGEKESQGPWYLSILKITVVGIDTRPVVVQYQRL